MLPGKPGINTKIQVFPEFAFHNQFFGQALIMKKRFLSHWWTRKKSDLVNVSFRPQGEILCFQYIAQERFLASLEMTSYWDFLRDHQHWPLNTVSMFYCLCFTWQLQIYLVIKKIEEGNGYVFVWKVKG